MAWWRSWHRRARKARELSWRDWWVIARARFWMAVSWFGLRLAGFERTRRWLAGRPPAAAAEVSPEQVQRLVFLIGVAARAGFTRHTCLPRSLVLQRFLVHRGLPAVLRIGVRREGGQIAGHAWVEVAGQAVGEPEDVQARFVPLLTGEEQPARR